METDYENRMVSADFLPEDDGDNPLRPRTLADYIGQEKVKENLSVFIHAAKIRGEALDHVLLYGRRDSARPLWPPSLRRRWGSISASPPAPPWNGRGISRPC